MSDEIRELKEGDGWAAAHVDTLGDELGFRKIRKPLGVTAFGVNAIGIPPGLETGRHSHEEQQELYFVHSGTVKFSFGDGEESVTVGPGGLVRVDPSTLRKMENVGEGNALYVIVGGKDGYVGRDGQAPEGEGRIASAGS